jgi:predicted O-linked N-acetylglucosamine transferase (SPINDLY family)
MHRDGRRTEAEKTYRQLIGSNPRNHQALSSLGVLLGESGRLNEAIEALERASALEVNPTYLTQLGVVYRLAGVLDAAAEAFGRILEVEPNFPDARLNLASILMDAGAYAHALPLLDEALRLGPDGARLRAAAARACFNLGQVDGALMHARRAVELAPHVASYRRQLGDLLDAHGEKPSAIASYRRAVELDGSDHIAHSALIVAMLSSPDFTANDHYAEARAWAERHAAPLRGRLPVPPNDKNPERRLRIGYVSPDFREHALQQFLVPLLEHHDQGAVEIFLYSSVDRPDVATDWYRHFAGSTFRDIRQMDDVSAANLVRSDRIDILVDLALHSSAGRLRIFACRPAPVQISWLGYVGTTGLDTIDYRITDNVLDPPDADPALSSETCLRLPETLWCYSALDSTLEVNPLPALSTDHVTFGSQNAYRKLHPGLLATWGRVLAAVPGSRLFLHADEHARERLKRELAREGVAADRIEFGGRVPRLEYLRRYQRIDIGLDTFPFNGATTTLDAAWMGVPVVTLSGASPLQRAGASIMTNLGLPELVATSEDAFVTKAVKLASDLNRLSQLRSSLRGRLTTSPLGNVLVYARHVEAAYRTAWRRYCEATAATSS